MKTIRVKSLPLKDVIKDISKALKVPVTEVCDEYRLDIPEEFGEGFIRGIDFEEGLGFIQYKVTFKKDLEIKYTLDDSHPLKFIYVTEGGITHQFEKGKELHNIDRFQSAIVASCKGDGHVLHFKGGLPFSIFSVEVNRKTLQPKIECDLDFVKDDLKEVFNDIKTENRFYHQGNYSLQMATLFDQVENFDKPELIRKLFLEGMSFRILSEHIFQYEKDLENNGGTHILRPLEVEMIRRAAQAIRSNIAEMQTVDKLAKEIGLNINKLQEGFKLLYHTTVNNYLQKVRLDMAQDLLMNSDYNISEIVNIIGLSSKSYFSKIFKEAYEISPSGFRKKNKITATNSNQNKL